MSMALKEPMSLEAFLDWESRQEFKYEFDGFQPVAMTGVTAAHSTIQRNLLGLAVQPLARPPLSGAWQRPEDPGGRTHSLSGCSVPRRPSSVTSSWSSRVPRPLCMHAPIAIGWPTSDADLEMPEIGIGAGSSIGVPD